jgi:hypothetical protein
LGKHHSFHQGSPPRGVKPRLSEFSSFFSIISTLRQPLFCRFSFSIRYPVVESSILRANQPHHRAPRDPPHKFHVLNILWPKIFKTKYLQVNHPAKALKTKIFPQTTRGEGLRQRYRPVGCPTLRPGASTGKGNTVPLESNRTRLPGIYLRLWQFAQRTLKEKKA